MYNPVSKSGAKFMRIGGIHFNYRPLFTFDANNGNIQNLDNLKEVIDSCRAAGIEPIIQVGYCPASLTCPPNTDLINNGTMYKKNFNLQTTIAANLVDALKNAYSTKPLLYYSIGNEPDLDTNCRANSWGGYRWDGSAITPQQTADSIATYLKAFSKAMKNIDNRIKIIGPEFADWNSDTASPIHRVMRRLVSIPNHCCPGKTKSSDFVF
jgi:hypothetical protein